LYEVEGDLQVAQQSDEVDPPVHDSAAASCIDHPSPARSVRAAVHALARGEMVVVADDAQRENEADLIVAAEFATTESIAFMVAKTTGILCVPMHGERLDQLRLPLMTEHNTEAHATAFTISVDYMSTGTGVSAEDRARTVRALADPGTVAEQLRRPGHVFPLRYRRGGVLKRAGHTEASIDLLRLAGVTEVGVISELVDDDGSMLRGPRIEQFAAQHGLVYLTVADLVRYRRGYERLVEPIGSATIPTRFGPFQAIAYRSVQDDVEHLALVRGEVAAHGKDSGGVLVRVHSECLTGDAIGSLRCDCGQQLQDALRIIAEEGCGVVVYLRGHEGRGIGLGHKLRAYALQEEGLDTVDANVKLGLAVDSREYGVGAQIVADLGLRRIRLITNNPSKYGGLEGHDLEIVERVPLGSQITAENINYLRTKRDRMGHLLNLPAAAAGDDTG
jgi:3,4-dihydroxy 2-butanone 4-phosphate synthase/GTP cyclohydrolase II